MKAFVSTWVLFGVALAGLTACGSAENDCHRTGVPCSTGSGGAGTSSGTQGGSGNGGDGGGVPGCDPTAGSKAVASSCGVFVSSSKGEDTNPGSQTAPVKTIARALALAKGKPVYACGEAFDQAVTIASGAIIFGALDCKRGWAYDSSKPTVVAPSVAGPALIVSSASDKVEIEDFAFTAKDAANRGESSIGAFIHDTTDVALVRVDIEAGTGAAGDDGTVAMYTFPEQMDLNGNNAMGANGGDTKTCSCHGSVMTSGGLGGHAGTGGQSGIAGTPELGDGEGGTPGGDCSGQSGHAGSVIGSAAGASTLGKLTVAGWEPEGGKDASDGGPGQGGGGGASLDVTGGGGGGGCGGCGGAGGKGGKGGGASIGLLIFNASVALDGGKLGAKDAGDGGKGVGGQPGQTIFGFKGNGVGTGCQGGSGGPGADGGASGGAAGGVSAAIFYKGSKPKLTKTTSSHGTAGMKGVGGDSGNNDGVAGQSGNILEAP
jgi:hypothetical protein